MAAGWSIQSMYSSLNWSAEVEEGVQEKDTCENKVAIFFNEARPLQCKSFATACTRGDAHKFVRPVKHPFVAEEYELEEKQLFNAALRMITDPMSDDMCRYKFPTLYSEIDRQLVALVQSAADTNALDIGLISSASTLPVKTSQEEKKKLCAAHVVIISQSSLLSTLLLITNLLNNVTLLHDTLSGDGAGSDAADKPQLKFTVVHRDRSEQVEGKECEQERAFLEVVQKVKAVMQINTALEVSFTSKVPLDKPADLSVVYLGAHSSTGFLPQSYVFQAAQISDKVVVFKPAQLSTSNAPTIELIADGFLRSIEFLKAPRRFHTMLCELFPTLDASDMLVGMSYEQGLGLGSSDTTNAHTERMRAKFSNVVPFNTVYGDDESGISFSGAAAAVSSVLSSVFNSGPVRKYFTPEGLESGSA